MPLAVALLAGCPAAFAQTVHSLPEVQVTGPRDAAIGSADSASEGAAEKAFFQSRPKQRPGDIVEAVPGVVATQHSGDGKANQYFLRGFNLDHGTDFAVTVDGMPVNMPTHGHGQGFADLNFLIPELVSGVRYRKGPYAAESGDFSLAGSASMDYVSALERPFGEVTLGSHGYRRALLGGSFTQDGHTWLAALELAGNNGPWEVAEHLRKASGVLRYSQGSQVRGWQVTGMAYQSRWTSTDQIPERAVDDGEVGRFGSLDPSDGGNTRRLSLSAKWFNHDAAGQTDISAYAIDYRFDLFSNFTYFLNDPAHGDQFEQTDRRRVFGAQAAHKMANKIAGLDGVLNFGVQWRGDRIGQVGLYSTEQRQRLGTVRDEKVSEDLFSVYAQQLINLSDRWRIYAGLRGDLLRYDVTGREAVYGAANSGSGHDSIVSPKLGLAYTLTPQHELYANAGTGFHSNDVRGATITTDPGTGLPAQRVPALVKGTGSELGWRFQPNNKLTVTAAAWQLRMASELVYAGDTGTTEPGRASSRHGVETTLRWQATAALRVEVDAAWSRARFRGEPPPGEGNYIDNAVEKVVAAGALWQQGQWTTTLRLRYLGPRALDTLNSVRSRGAALLNFGTRYAVTPHLTVGLDVFNLANRSGNDIEYLYASCTARESVAGSCGSDGVTGRHFHPMEPRSVRLVAKLGF